MNTQYDIIKPDQKSSMKYLIKPLIILCVFGCGISLHAQNAIPATGGNANGAGGTSSYTIGQVVYTTETETNGTIAQGIQQPFEILIVTGIIEASEIDLECSVYPNPTTNLLILKIGNYDKENLSYQLFDINGKHLEINKVMSGETQIEMEKLASGTFVLKVFDNNKEVKTFKIIKN